MESRREGSAAPRAVAELQGGLKRGETVLLVDPSKTGRDKALGALRGIGYKVNAAADVFEAHALVDGAAVVLAAHPFADALYPRLRAAGIPLVAVFAPRTAEPARLAEELGADAFVLRPYKREVLNVALYAATSARLLRERADRAESALADITGVRREGDKAAGLLHIDLFKKLLPLEIRRARRHRYPIALCVVSLDAPPGAPAVPHEVASACEPFLRRAVRDVDLAVRYGDDRFLVFLPHTDVRGAETVGKRIGSELRKCRFKLAGVTMMVTASVGISAPRADKSPSFARLIRDAQIAVKAAQLKGGDRVILR